MKNEEFKEMINTLLNAKLTDFCGKDTYEILTMGNLFRQPEEKSDMLNYTLRDYIEMYSKIDLSMDELRIKLPGIDGENFNKRVTINKRNEFKRKVYLHTLYRIILTANNPNLLILSDETVEIVGNEYFNRIDDDFDPNLRDIIRKIFKMNVKEYFYKIVSLYAHNFNQGKMLLESYYNLENALETYKMRYENEKVAEQTIDDIDVGTMLLLLQDYSYKCDAIRNDLLLNPLRIACDVTEPIWV